jgi:hypothetical protein
MRCSRSVWCVGVCVCEEIIKLPKSTLLWVFLTVSGGVDAALHVYA